MLEVNILLKEAGLWRKGVDGGPPQAAIMVVPLFETIADLNAAPDIMAAYFGLPEISALVTGRGYPEGMIGYYYRNKDGGYFTSPWGTLQPHKSPPPHYLRAAASLHRLPYA